MKNKRTKGRQKIDMKKRENEEDRLITFSKRRAGIYKKASELCTLCDAEVGIIIFSPSGKPFSFSHPSMAHIANRFLNRKQQPIDSTSQLVEAHSRAKINDLSRKLSEQIVQVEAEKQWGEKLDQMVKPRENKSLWGAPIDEFSKDEVKKRTAWLEELHMKINNRLNEFGAEASSSSSAFAAATTAYSMHLGSSKSTVPLPCRRHGHGGMHVFPKK